MRYAQLEIILPPDPRTWSHVLACMRDVTVSWHNVRRQINFRRQQCAGTYANACTSRTRTLSVRTHGYSIACDSSACHTWLATACLPCRPAHTGGSQQDRKPAASHRAVLLYGRVGHRRPRRHVRVADPTADSAMGAKRAHTAVDHRPRGEVWGSYGPFVPRALRPRRLQRDRATVAAGPSRPIRLLRRKYYSKQASLSRVSRLAVYFRYIDNSSEVASMPWH